MRAGLGTLLLLIFASFFLFVSTNALAQGNSILPPQSIVFETDSIYYTQPPGTFQLNGSITFKLSPQDPDQVNGDWQYSAYFISHSDPVGWFRQNFTHVPIPEAPGWARHPSVQWTGPSLGQYVDFAFNLTVWNNTTESSVSCLINVTDIRPLGQHYECGNMLEAPSGVGLVSTRNAQTSGTSEGPISIPALTDIRWHLSPDDPNSTHGNFSYYPYVGSDPNLLTNYTGIVPNMRSAGVLNFTVETFTSAANQRFPFYAVVYARNNFSLQISNASCLAYLSSGSVLESSGCGTFGNGLASVADGTPHYPGFNLTNAEERMGLSTSLIGVLLASATVLVATLVGLTTLGVVGAIVMFPLTIVLVTYFNLSPGWLLVVLFMGALGYVTIKLKGGSQE